MTHSSTSYQTKLHNKIFAQLFGISLLLILGLCATAQNTLVGLASNGGPEGRGTAFSISTTGNNFSVIKGFADWGKAPLGNLFKNDDGNFYGMTSDGGTFNYGTIFMMTPAGKVTVLRQLDYDSDGAYPNGDLIKGADGYLYGGTTDGGAHGYGTIFKISTSGDFTVVRSLNYSDGVSIYGHLTLASDGNFYGITYRGGSTGAGTIFKMTPAGVFSVLHNMNENADGSSSLSSLTEGKDGNLYGTAYDGGANSYGTIFKITKAGALTTLKSFNGSSDGYYCSSDLVQASDNNFYGTCYGGGANSSGTIFKISVLGTYSVVKNFNYSTDGGNPKGGLLLNTDGNFYGITKSGGSKSGGTIYKLTSANVFSVLHAFDYTTEGNGSNSALVKGNDGKLYAMTGDGGIYEMGTAFSVTTDGTFNVIASFNGAAQGNAPFASFVKGLDSAYYATTSTGGSYGYGTIIKICGGVTTVLHSFKQSTDGGNPLGRLVRATDGNFYGLASTGGTNSIGTIFKITPAGNFSVLYNLKSTDGKTPVGSLIQATDGYLYGMTEYGGTTGDGTIFKINLAGNFSTIRSLVYSTDGSRPNGSLIQANDGNFYGMTYSNPKLFKLTQSGAFSIVHSFQYADGAYPYGNVIQAADGNLYGTCSEGGTSGYGTIFQSSLSGTFKVLHNFLSSGGGQTPKGSLLQGADGTLYGLTSEGGTYDAGTIFKMSTNGSNYTELRQMNLRTDGGAAFGDLIFAPINNLIANAQSVTVNEDASVKITLTGSGGAPLSYAVVTNPAHGKLTGTAPNLTYKPDTNYNGTDKFTFNVSVGCISSPASAITITVKPVADTPVLAKINNKTVYVDSLVKFTARATDADSGQTITYSLIGAPAGATINKTSGLFKWTPGATGVYTFKVRATDNDTPPLYDEQQVKITVNALTLNIVNNAFAITNKTKANIFPNPVDNELNIILPKAMEKLSVSVIDMTGKTVSTQMINMQGSSLATIDASALARGIYVLQLQGDDYSESMKFIKK